jgi:hypothetical protein
MTNSTYRPEEASKLIDQETSTKLSAPVKLVPSLTYPTYSPSEALSLIHDKGILDTNRVSSKKPKTLDREEEEEYLSKKSKKHSRKR